jgi:hypothetical protein
LRHASETSKLVVRIWFEIFVEAGLSLYERNADLFDFEALTEAVLAVFSGQL